MNRYKFRAWHEYGKSIGEDMKDTLYTVLGMYVVLFAVMLAAVGKCLEGAGKGTIWAADWVFEWIQNKEHHWM